MIEKRSYIELLKKYAEYYDANNEFSKADDCTRQIYRIAHVKTSGNFFSELFHSPLNAIERNIIRPVGKFVDKIGEELDKAVRKYLPGGWTSVLLYATGQGVFGRGAMQAYNQFFGAGGKIEQLVNSDNPAERAAGLALQDMANDMLKEGQTRSQSLPGGPAAPASTGPMTWGEEFFKTNENPMTSAVIQSPAGLLNKFVQDAIEYLVYQNNQSSAQVAFNKIKSSGVDALKAQINKMESNSPTLKLIDPSLQRIKNEVLSRRRWNLQ